MITAAKPSLLLILCALLIQCRSTPDGAVYSARFRTGTNKNYILMGCAVYAAENKGKAGNIPMLLEIDSLYRQGFRKKANVNKMIGEYLRGHGDVDFQEDSAVARVQVYADCAYTIFDVFFEQVKEDSDEAGMKRLEQKMAKVPELYPVYRKYMPETGDLNSLHGGWIEAYTDITYALSKLGPERRKEVGEILR